MTLSEYLKKQGQGAQKRLAEQIGAHQPDVSDWANGARPVPVARCAAIEQVTGGEVTRRELRPEDWQKYWPELVQQPAA